MSLGCICCDRSSHPFALSCVGIAFTGAAPCIALQAADFLRCGGIGLRCGVVALVIAAAE